MESGRNAFGAWGDAVALPIRWATRGVWGTVNDLVQCIEGWGEWAPAGFAGLFLAASFLMIWRLNAMTEYGFQGTALGTLVMPFCSGLGNLIFVFIIAAKNGPAQEVFTNALVNNVTNLTLLTGLPALLWGLQVLPEKKPKKKDLEQHQLNRLSLLLTLLAVGFFTGATWALARDGRLDLSDGLVLVGLFVFWQTFHVFDVLKHNIRQKHSPNPLLLLLDLAVLGFGAWLMYVSIDWLVSWLGRLHTGFFRAENLGWLSGWLMVLPNAVLALYYGWRRRPDIVLSSQVGDGHVSIPLCLGVLALIEPVPVPAFFNQAALLLVGAAAVHFVCVAALGRLPRFMGALLIAAYVWFLAVGLL